MLCRPTCHKIITDPPDSAAVLQQQVRSFLYSLTSFEATNNCLRVDVDFCMNVSSQVLLAITSLTVFIVLFLSVLGADVSAHHVFLYPLGQLLDNCPK